MPELSAPDVTALTRSAARRAGCSDKRLAALVRAGALHRYYRGAYVDPLRASAPDAFYRYPAADEAIARARAALTVLPPGCALADDTAAFLLAGLWPPDARPRVVAPAPLTCRRRGGIVLREAPLAEREVRVVAGLRVTSGTRTAVDLARRSPRPRGLVAVDALLHAEQTSVPAVAVELARWCGARGVVHAREVLGLADGRAESPGESLIRLALLDAGLTPLDLQVPVLGGRYRIDIVVRGLVHIEFEGTHHDGERTRRIDRPRFNALDDLPGKVRRYDSTDLRRLDLVVADVAQALATLPAASHLR